MDEEELMQRWVAMEAGIDSTHLRDARFSEESDREGQTEWDRVEAAHTRLLDLPGKLWIDDTSNNTDIAMRSKAKRIQAKHGLDLIIVDYLQFARAGSGKKQDRRLEVEEVSRNLKTLAREIGVPVLALAQLNREVEQRADRKPKLSDLREAGGIEQDCDVAMFIYKRADIPETAVDFPVELLIEKHRNGQKGMVPLYFVGAQTRFYPAREERIA
jgi:replicative DNA helicase